MKNSNVAEITPHIWDHTLLSINNKRKLYIKGWYLSSMQYFKISTHFSILNNKLFSGGFLQALQFSLISEKRTCLFTLKQPEAWVLNLFYVITWTLILSFSEHVEWLINTTDNLQTIRFQVVNIDLPLRRLIHSMITIHIKYGLLDIDIL